MINMILSNLVPFMYFDIMNQCLSIKLCQDKEMRSFVRPPEFSHGHSDA